MKKLIIATRGSKLALWQSEYIKERLESTHQGLVVELKTMKTKGDIILDTPLAKIGGKGLFTKELEDAMLKGEAHIAVHSLKDVPTEFPEGLKLGVITKREDVRDAMLSENMLVLMNFQKVQWLVQRVCVDVCKSWRIVLICRSKICVEM